MKKVDIGRTVDYETLERALRSAAEKVGLRATFSDQYSEGYRLGSVQETKAYSHTIVNLSGRFLPAMEIIIYDKHPTNRFSVWSGLGWGFASKSTVKAYLSAVSEALSV
ncbi:hypothetical protein HYT23_03550 [Candidatus Pacearchaeota archaeon]|nr:hypothetical protein [Candidatus Pacearchaeota archaeon]